MRNGSRRGEQRPRLLSLPEYDSTELGREAVELARHAGLVLDPWEAFVLERSLAEKAGKWAAFEVGLIVPRQNGKGSILEARELAGLFLLDEELILHSAHEFKDLDLSTPMLTTAGWSTMGELCDGDEVFAPDGQPTKVLAAHSVLRSSDCYRVRMADGQEVVAGGGHLWAVTEVDMAGRCVSRVVTTDEIRVSGLTYVMPRQGRDRRVYRWRIDLPEPLVLPDVCFPVDPYLLGMWLGDGSTGKGEITVGTDNLPHVLCALRRLGETFHVRPDRRWPDRVVYVHVDGLRQRLRSIGTLDVKRIPASYLLASAAQRSDLLAGILDTDGTVSAHQIAVTMVRPDLMEDVLTLVRSLGYRATLREFRASLNGRDTGPMWRVQFRAGEASPFRLVRKSERVLRLKATRSQYNTIVSVERVPTRPTRCITVAHESGCYLAGRGLLPTHNTASEAFRRIARLVEDNPDFDRRVRRIRTANGSEMIELRGGQRLRFVARSKGSGRGFSGDLVILDEAYNLGDQEMEALLPTLSARPNPQVWYTSSAGDESSIQLGRVRARGVEGGDPGLAFFEWSVDETAWFAGGIDPADREQWALSNPGLGIRISEEHVARELTALGVAGFAKERLGAALWPSDPTDAWQVISRQLWRDAEDGESSPVGDVVLAFDVTPDRMWGSIGCAGVRDDGLWHVEVVDHRQGVGWIPERVAELNTSWFPAGIVVDPGGPAGSLITEVEQLLGAPLVKPSMRQVGQAAAVLVDAVCDPESVDVRHRGQAPLSAAVAGATTRPLGDGWAWDRRQATVVLSPLVACSLALASAQALLDAGLAPDDVYVGRA